MPFIKIKKLDDYDSPLVKTFIEEVFSQKPIPSGSKVLIKPNMISAKRPEEAATTHPQIIKVVAQTVLDMGAKPTIADSPGIDPFSLVAKTTGIAEVGKTLGVPVVPLENSTLTDRTPGRQYKILELSKTALEADHIINLPKMKTHGQMLLTLGVKNLFGAVVAQRKAQWHYKVGLDRDLFASLLLDILAEIPPHITILDGITGMEGSGPTSGKPRNFGILAASDDPIAMDTFLAQTMGVQLKDFPLWRAAKEKNRGNWNLQNVQWLGDYENLKFENVDVPKLDALRLAPKFLDNFAKLKLTAKPAQNIKRCVKCGKCVEICPVKAISWGKEGRLTFDYLKCIRCYCCHEMCPADAIELHKSLLLKTIEKLSGRIS